MDRRIFALRKQMLSNLRHQPTINEMAETVNVSAPHLRKLFKSETGISPICFLRNLRLEKARKLLETSFKRVKEIRFEVGIKDHSHFVKDFKQKHGCSPLEYRRKHHEKLEVEEANASK